jgi:hypothetical protein
MPSAQDPFYVVKEEIQESVSVFFFFFFWVGVGSKWKLGVYDRMIDPVWSLGIFILQILFLYVL